MCSAPFFYVKKDSKFKELTTFSISIYIYIAIPHNQFDRR